MNLTKDAMKLFLKSLPDGCQFQIVSFGSNFKYLKGTQNLLQYNKENSQYAESQVGSFDAEMGGTEIYRPIESVF